MMIDFFVPGEAKPAGSKVAFTNRVTGKAILVDASKNKPWRGAVQMYCKLSYNGPLLDEPLVLMAEFHVLRPKAHFRSNGQLKDWAVEAAPHARCDITKLLRCIEDSLNKVLWRDDRLVVEQHARLIWSDKPGAHIWVADWKTAKAQYWPAV